MPYNANIPLATDQLSQSQLDLLNNFQSINTWVNVNHVGFNVANQGKHFFVEFPVPVATPVTIAGEVGLYSRQSTITNQPELVFAHQFGSTAPAGARIVEFTSAGWANTGWCRFPSGILHVWSTVTTSNLNSNSDQVIQFPGGAVPPFLAVYSIQITGTAVAGQDPNSAFYYIGSNIGAQNFTVRQQARGGIFALTRNTFTYLAIGLG